MSKPTAKHRKFDFHILPVIEWIGLEKVVKQVGVNRVVEAVCEVLLEKAMKRLIRRNGRAWLLAQLTPQQRRELKTLLQD